MAEENIASIVPRQDVVDEFVRYGDQIHKTLTWTGGCRSWYKGNRIHGRYVVLSILAWDISKEQRFFWQVLTSRLC